MNVAESGLEKHSATGFFLDLSHRITPHRVQLLLLLECFLDEFEPGTARQIKTEGQSVKKQPENAFAINFFRSSVRDDASQNIRLPSDQAHRSQMRRQEDRLERYSGLPRQVL